MQLEYIALIVNYIHFSGLLDYVYFATSVPTYFVGIYCHFALSSMQLEYIALIVNYIHFSGLLDYVYFATNPCPADAFLQNI